MRSRAAAQYITLVKTAEHRRDLSPMEKSAMWRSFFDELGHIKQAGVLAETIGGLGGLITMDKAIRKVHPGPMSDSLRLALLTGGTVAGAVMAKGLSKKLSSKPAPGTPGSMDYTEGRERTNGMGLLAASWYAQAHARPSLSVVKTAKAKKEDDPYSRVGDSVWDKHKGKILGGLALATAAGVGAKLLHNRHRKMPVSTAPTNMHVQAPVPVTQPPAVPHAKPKPPPKPVHEAPKPAPRPPRKPSPADVQAAADPRKQHRREKFERRRAKHQHDPKWSGFEEPGDFEE